MLSAAALVTGTVLVDSAPARVVLALLLVGFAIKLALVPAYVWLPSVARSTPAALVGLVVAVVDVAAFAELISLRRTSPWLFSPTWPWLTLALLSAVGGALLALAQRDVKRMLAFSTITGAGFLVLGVCAGRNVRARRRRCRCCGGRTGQGPAVRDADRRRDRRPGDPGVPRCRPRHPLAAAGFLAGSLAALGVPFTAGFAGHWRVYATALHSGGPVLALLIVATILSVLAYSRVVALVWWGSPEGEAPVPARPAPLGVGVGERVPAGGDRGGRPVGGRAGRRSPPADCCRNGLSDEHPRRPWCGRRAAAPRGCSTPTPAAATAATSSS